MGTAEEQLGIPPDFLPEFALTVGVTGHRSLPLDQQDRIKRQLRQILAKIEEISQEISRQGREIGIFPREPRLRLASCLSEGSDRLAAEAALEHGFGLQAFLPFPKDSEVNAMDLHGQEREKSRKHLRELCGKAECVVEFSPVFPEEFQMLGMVSSPVGDDELAMAYRQDAYLDASKAMLAQSDVLIAIWNGKPQAAAGGTYDTMLKATSEGVPICVIDSKSDRPIQIISCKNDFSAPSCSLKSFRDTLIEKWGSQAGSFARTIMQGQGGSGKKCLCQTFSSRKGLEYFPESYRHKKIEKYR